MTDKTERRFVINQ